MGPLLADGACLLIAPRALGDMNRNVLWLDEGRALGDMAVGAVPRVELDVALVEALDEVVCQVEADGHRQTDLALAAARGKGGLVGDGDGEVLAQTVLAVLVAAGDLDDAVSADFIVADDAGDGRPITTGPLP